MQNLNLDSFEQFGSLQPGHNSPETRAPVSLAQSQFPVTTLQIREGELVFKQGEAPKGLYCLKSGAIKLVTQRTMSRGRITNPEFINKIVAPGEFFGFKAAIKSGTHPFYAEALMASEVSVYSLEAVEQIMKGPDSILKMVLLQIASDLESHEQTAQLHYLASVQERISYQLSLLAEKFGEPTDSGLSLNLHLTRNELAQLAGTINESLSRHLTELKSEGIIEVRGKEIIVKNLLALKEKSGNFGANH